MTEAAAFFALGVVTMAIVALSMAGALWRRAVRSTRRKLQTAAPLLSRDEMAADRDQLRAEFALSARRLESSVERLRERAVEQAKEIEEKRATIARLDEEQTARMAAVDRLATRDAELTRQIERQQERLAETNAEMATLRLGLAERGRALDQLETTLKRAEEDSAGKTVELVAQETAIDNLRDELAAARARATQLTVERTRLDAELAELRAAAAVEQQHAASLETRLVRFETDRGGRLADIDARDHEIERLAGELTARHALVDRLERRAAAAEAAYADAESRVSLLTLRLNEVGRAGAAESERNALLDQIDALHAAYEQLAAENAEYARLAGSDWDAERLENALLRERLNDIAHEVSRLAGAPSADVAGSDPAPAGPRPIQDLARLGAPPARSLTDRLRAMQRGGG